MDKHLKIKAYGCPFNLLKDLDHIRTFLIHLVKRIKMRSLGPPHIYDVRTELKKRGLEPYPEEPDGVTGICVLSTSHVAASTWPHRGYAVIDVYSCTDFSTEDAEEFIKERLEAKNIEVIDLSFSMSDLDDLPIVHPPET